MHHPTPGELASAADGPTFLWTVIGAGAIPAFLDGGRDPLPHEGAALLFLGPPLLLMVGAGLVHVPMVAILAGLGAWSGFRDAPAPTPGAWRRG